MSRFILLETQSAWLIRRCWCRCGVDGFTGNAVSNHEGNLLDLQLIETSSDATGNWSAKLGASSLDRFPWNHEANLGFPQIVEELSCLAFKHLLLKRMVRVIKPSIASPIRQIPGIFIKGCISWCCWKISEGIHRMQGNVWVNKRNFLATIEEFLKDRKGPDFRVPWNLTYVRICRRFWLNWWNLLSNSWGWIPNEIGQGHWWI